VTEPLIIFLCEGAAAYNLASSIEHAAREAGLDANAEGVFHTSGNKVEPAVFVSKNDVIRRPDANHQHEPDRQQRQQQQQGWTDTWQVIVAGSVPIAAFAVFAKNCLDIFIKTKGLSNAPKSIEATIDGRKIKIHAGDEVRDIVRRYDEST
jgi:hypothetical protein